jgi:CheY-like chemotaxis protein
MQDKTVLVAEDSQLIRALVVAALKPLECTVVEAENGEEAIRLARELKPDVVLLDVVMPKVDGYSVLEALRGDSGCDGCAIIMLTTAASQADLEHSKESGADGHIVKPFDKDDLRAEVTQYLER